MKPLSLFLSLFSWGCISVQAQPYTASVKHYNTENGLSHREVNAIFQDKQGFMWFGTKFGLNRFDGKTFTTFTKDRNGLTFDDIHSIVQDTEGNLWLGGANETSQVALFNPLTEKAIPFEKAFSEQLTTTSRKALQSPVSNDSGAIFLTNYKPAVLLSYHPKAGLRSVALPQFTSLGIFRVTNHNTVWAIADENRIVELTPEGQILHQYLHGQDIVSWCFGGRHAGIEFFYTVYNPANVAHHTFYSVDESGHRKQWPEDLLASIKRYMGPVCHPVDRTGLIWDGISLRDSTNHTLLTIAGQTLGKTIENRSFYCDRNGLFWLGTSFGIYQVKLTPNHFKRLLHGQDNKGGNGAAIRGITVLGNQVC